MATCFVWNKLPLEVQQMVVGNMDVVTRCRFVQCSTWTQYAVRSTPLHVDKAVFNTEYDYDSGIGNHKITLGSFEKKEQFEFDTRKDIMWEEPPVEFKKILEKILLWETLEIESFTTNWPLPIACIENGRRLKIRNIRLPSPEHVEHHVSVSNWLAHLWNGVNTIALSGDWAETDNNPDFQNLRPALNAQKFYMTSETIDVTPEFLLNSHARTIMVVNGPNRQKPKTINSLIKKWIDKDYPVGATFCLDMDTMNQTNFDEACLMEGLDYIKRVRSFDEKLEYIIRMRNPTKYLELSPVETNKMAHFEMTWNVRAVVRNVLEPTSTASCNWNNMPKKVKVLIAQKLDFITRTRLKVCSKSDKELVESTPITISKLIVDDECIQIDDEFRITDDYANVTISNSDIINLKDKKLFSSWFQFPEGGDGGPEVFFSHEMIRELAKNPLISVKCVEYSGGPVASNLLNDAIQLPMFAQAGEYYSTTHDSFNQELLQWSYLPRLFHDIEACPRYVNDYIKHMLEENYPVDSYFRCRLKNASGLRKLLAGLSWKKIGGSSGDFTAKTIICRHKKNIHMYLHCTFLPTGQDMPIDFMCKIVRKNLYHK